MKLQLTLASWDDLHKSLEQQATMAEYDHHAKQHPDFEQWCSNLLLMLADYLTTNKYKAWTTIFEEFLASVFDDLEFERLSEAQLSHAQREWNSPAYTNATIPPSCGPGTFFLAYDRVGFRYSGPRDFLLKQNMLGFLATVSGPKSPYYTAFDTQFADDQCAAFEWTHVHSEGVFFYFLPAFAEEYPKEFWSWLLRYEKLNKYNSADSLSRAILATGSGTTAKNLADLAVANTRAWLQWVNYNDADLKKFVLFTAHVLLLMPPKQQKVWANNAVNHTRYFEMFWHKLLQVMSNHIDKEKLQSLFVPALAGNTKWFVKWFDKQHRLEWDYFVPILLQKFAALQPVAAQQLLTRVVWGEHHSVENLANFVENCADHLQHTPLLIEQCKKLVAYNDNSRRARNIPNVRALAKLGE